MELPPLTRAGFRPAHPLPRWGEGWSSPSPFVMGEERHANGVSMARWGWYPMAGSQEPPLTPYPHGNAPCRVPITPYPELFAKRSIRQEPSSCCS